jgi:hypothetical protein
MVIDCYIHRLKWGQMLVIKLVNRQKQGQMVIKLLFVSQYRQGQLVIKFIN